MKVKALLFVIFTLTLFAFGVLITTIFNTAPISPDALAMFYGSFFLTFFGLSFFTVLILTYLRTRVTPGRAIIKNTSKLALIIDLLITLLLVMKSYEVLSWVTAVILAVLAVVVSVILRKRAGP